MTTYLEEEDECRVCRDTGSESEPLISPCKCDGSIRFVHEACLVKWLEIKKSETCELCGHKFKFAAIYRDDTPAILPCCEMFNAFFGMCWTTLLYNKPPLTTDHRPNMKKT